MDDGFKQQLQKQALEATVKTVQQKIATLVCPAHQQSPRLKFSEDSGPGEQKMSFDCCCDTLAQMLQAALKS
ncbi:MAG TPA: hypothetical protein VK859_03075 [bacterium]|jgi:hypothetical protein|nr:hypothetical protein [bacterium]